MLHEHLAHNNTGIKSSADRSCGVAFAAFFLVVALVPLLRGNGIRLWALGLATVFLIITLAAPKSLAPLNCVWTRFGELLYRIVSPIALGVLFYAVVTPIGLFVHLVGKDPLRLRIDKSAKSYWIERRSSGFAPDRFKLPF